jgi:ABC-type transport system involved in Fe-S cluster assembly fused permease/ATPase subunit
VAVYGSIAYAAQVAFIQNSTLKDNIVYGNPYDEALYQQTLEMCALLPDIRVLPAGHDTEIGERGINLSGGGLASVPISSAIFADVSSMPSLCRPKGARGAGACGVCECGHLLARRPAVRYSVTV